MGVSNDGWLNKNATSNRTCTCGTWKQHWINFSNKEWPKSCSVKGCTNNATLGAHVINKTVSYNATNNLDNKLERVSS